MFIFIFLCVYFVYDLHNKIYNRPNTHCCVTRSYNVACTGVIAVLQRGVIRTFWYVRNFTKFYILHYATIRYSTCSAIVSHAKMRHSLTCAMCTQTFWKGACSLLNFRCRNSLVCPCMWLMDINFISIFHLITVHARYINRRSFSSKVIVRTQLTNFGSSI